jgi:hypothetical protein
LIEKWIGTLKIVFIGAAVDPPGFELPPNWKERLLQRIHYDPDPATGIDRSLRTYISRISQGKAQFDADVVGPVVVTPCDTGQAINAIAESHLYDVACVVYPDWSPCEGMAVLRSGPFPYFDPPRAPNRLLGWCRFKLGDALGTWAMELLHAATGFDDLYKTESHPQAFDEMACACGTHPSSFTKSKLGWLDDNAIETAALTSLSGASYILHALSLPQPAPFGRVTAVRIPTSRANRYFLVEARLRTDEYERSTTKVSRGIAAEGVVIYEVDEAVWAPMKLRTLPVLTVGETYSNPAAGVVVTVKSALPGAFAVDIVACVLLTQEIAKREQRIVAMKEQLDTQDDTALIEDKIAQEQSVLDTLRLNALANGCEDVADVMTAWLEPVLAVMMTTPARPSAVWLEPVLLVMMR